MKLNNIYYTKTAKNKHSFFSGSSNLTKNSNQNLKNNFKKAGLIFCVIGSLLFFASCSKKSGANNSANSSEITNGNFIEGVSIYNVDVGGKSIQDAELLVTSKIALDQAAADLSLHYDEQTLDLKLTDLKLSNNLDIVLQEAILYGQDGSKKANAAVQEETALNKKNFDLEFKADENVITQKLDGFAVLVAKEPQEPKATFNPETNKLEFTEGEAGITLDTNATKSLILETISNAIFPATIQAIVIEALPTKTNEEIQANTGLIAKFSTSFDGNAKPERVANIILGAQKINARKVNPGEQFSFNDIVGPRDAKNNWQMAATIVNGNTFEDDYGGGICQVSTTLFIAVAKSDLKIVNRQRHSIPSSYVPIGMDATVAYGSKDFVFANNKDYPIYVFANVDKAGKSMEVLIYGPAIKDYDEIKLRKVVVEEIQPGEGEIVEDASAKPGSKETVIKRRSGFVVDVFKDYIKNGEVQKSVKMHTDTYRAEPGVVKVGVSVGSTAPTTVSEEDIPAETSNDTDTDTSNSETTDTSENTDETNIVEEDIPLVG